MRTFFVFFLLFTLAIAPILAQAQHHWLIADPVPLPRKSPIRISLVAGDSLKPNPATDQVQLKRFAAYMAKDSLALAPLATGTTVLIQPGEIKDPAVAGAEIILPQSILLLPEIKGQFTKEQKAILALQDTSKWRNGVPAQHIHYAKVHVPTEKDKDKAEVFGKQLNHELEIIPRKDPAQLTAGQEMVVQFLLHQRLLPNHNITVWFQDENGKITRSQMKTGKYGMRVFSLRKPGNYLIQIEQKGPHQFGLSEEVVWQDLEATYQFTIK